MQGHVRGGERGLRWELGDMMCVTEREGRGNGIEEGESLQVGPSSQRKKEKGRGKERWASVGEKEGGPAVTSALGPGEMFGPGWLVYRKKERGTGWAGVWRPV